MISIAIIGGTGVYDPNILTNIETMSVPTPYGEVSFKVGSFEGKRVAFLPRHGSGHSIPPHLINYRANIWALKKIGVNNILATTAVGSLNLSMKPGDFVLVDQFLDFTKTRHNTFYDGDHRGVVHIDMTTPYCPKVRQKVCTSANNTGISIHKTGTYVCTEGPRFESPAEIKMFAQVGGDLVGMTNVPEVVLAREAEICYVTISMVTNFAAGISPQPLTHSEVVETMDYNKENIKRLIMATISLLEPNEDCPCKSALSEYGGFKLE